MCTHNTALFEDSWQGDTYQNSKLKTKKNYTRCIIIELSIVPVSFYISVEYECPLVFLGLKNPLASLLSGKLSAVPRDRVEEIIAALQADIADPGSLSPLAALLLGELWNSA
jgi:hypothetical protein